MGAPKVNVTLSFDSITFIISFQKIRGRESILLRYMYLKQGFMI